MRILFPYTTFFLACLFLSCGNPKLQDPGSITTEWINKLSTGQGPVNSGINEVLDGLKGKDSATGFKILNEIEKKGDFQNNYFKARFSIAKSRWLFSVIPVIDFNKSLISAELKEALNAAYETNNDSLISEVAWAYGITSYLYGKVEPAATYCLFAAELDNKINKPSAADKCWYLGVILYQTRDYEKALQYTEAAIQREPDTSQVGKRLNLSRRNTVALCYQRMEAYDSAFAHYKIAMKMAEAAGDTVWKAILSGNMGQIYYLQKNYSVAKPLLFFDYTISKAHDEQSSAANTLQWLARINLLEGKKDTALLQVKEALQLVEKKGDQSAAYYRQNIYAAAVDVYRAFGNTDSTFRYATLYNRVHDSLERAVADSRLEISRIKLDNIQNALALKNILKEKQAMVQQRNLVALVVVMLGLIAILLLNRQRQKAKHRQELALQDKRIAESKIAMAESERRTAIEQLDNFTQNLVEKSNLVEKLQQQLQTSQSINGQEDVIRELTQQTILTEEDWTKFKTLFETIYPGFFSALRQQYPEITLAELRMAALIRLQLQPKQMAALLGISINSVYKAKQRLRQRFKKDADWEIELYIAEI